VSCDGFAHGHMPETHWLGARERQVHLTSGTRTARSNETSTPSTQVAALAKHPGKRAG
jgi:hypothetical protein